MGSIVFVDSTKDKNNFDFVAPGYVWRPGSGNVPGSNVFICCVFDRRDCS